MGLVYDILMQFLKLNIISSILVVGMLKTLQNITQLKTTSLKFSFEVFTFVYLSCALCMLESAMQFFYGFYQTAKLFRQSCYWKDF